MPWPTIPFFGDADVQVYANQWYFAFISPEGMLPQPLRKSADAAWPSALELRFPSADVIEISGNTQPPFAWALQLASTAGGWQVDRGELHAGPGEARIPSRSGLVITGAPVCAIGPITPAVRGRRRRAREAGRRRPCRGRG